MIGGTPRQRNGKPNCNRVWDLRDSGRKKRFISGMEELRNDWIEDKS
jgi:hypothetical protein